jgi:hypothetical protein
MPAVSTVSLRRLLSQRGLTPATWIPEASQGRAEEATIKPARLVEGEALAAHPVGRAEPWPDSVAFLDGIQRYEIVGYLDTTPLVVARVAAAVRERPGPGSRPRLAVSLERRLAIGRPEVLERVADMLGDTRLMPLGDEVAGHPVREVQAARKVVDRERGAAELEVGRQFRTESDSWLVIDGALSEGIDWVADPRMVGIVKSHSTLPFAGAVQVAYLRTPYAHRSSVFAPETRSLAPVHSWALRLWPWEGEDLFHGLVRIETSAGDDTLSGVDQLSRWLLAERAPISAPDPRWDRLLYGIHDVEVYLRARMGR